MLGDDPNAEFRMVAGYSQPDVQGRIKAAYKIMMTDKPAYDELNAYHDGRQAEPYIPLHSSQETVELQKRSTLNMMTLAVDIPAQISFVDGFWRKGDLFPEEWKNAWDRNNMPAKQTQIYKAALKYGQAFVGLENLGNDSPDIKLYATRNTVAMFADPVNDIHPVYLFTIKSFALDAKNPGRAVYMDDKQIIHYDVNKSKTNMFTPRQGETYKHAMEVCPAVRYVVELDDEGAVRGVIEPLIPLQDSINQSKFNLLANAQFSSFKVRWAAGMVGQPMRDGDGNILYNEDGKIIYRAIEVSPSRLLTTEATDGKFGTLDETPIDGFISSLEAQIRHFAVKGQLPPHSLLGNMSNLSAETLTAAMGQTLRFGHVLKTTWGQTHEALLRLVALDLGIAIEDYSGEVRWRDMSDTMFAATMDGLGKGVAMLGIPQRAAWSRVPGVTTGDLENWDKEAEKQAEREANAALNEPTPQGAARREARPVARTAPTPRDAFGGGTGGNASRT